MQCGLQIDVFRTLLYSFPNSRKTIYGDAMFSFPLKQTNAMMHTRRAIYVGNIAGMVLRIMFFGLDFPPRLLRFHPSRVHRA